jgi:hypothetical protein
LHALAPVGFRQFGEQKRQFDVARRSEHRQQVVQLKHKPDVPRAPGRESRSRQLVDAIATNSD